MEKDQSIKIEETPISLIEILDAINVFSARLNKRFDLPPFLMPTEIRDPVELIRAETERDEMFQEFIQELLEKKEGFKHVFTTSFGSYYFVLETGESMRIKRNKGFDREEGGKVADYFDIMHVMKKIIFIPANYIERLRNDGDIDQWAFKSLDGVEVEVSNCVPGTYPMELDYTDTSPLSAEDTGNGKIKFIANPNRIHVGHPVVEVLK